MVNLIEEIGQVADPTQSASAGTEAALRANPVTGPFAFGSDAADGASSGNSGSDNEDTSPTMEREITTPTVERARTTDRQDASADPPARLPVSAPMLLAGLGVLLLLLRGGL